jgi:hypothetical protein
LVRVSGCRFSTASRSKPASGAFPTPSPSSVSLMYLALFKKVPEISKDVVANPVPTSLHGPSGVSATYTL